MDSDLRVTMVTYVVCAWCCVDVISDVPFIKGHWTLNLYNVNIVALAS